MCKRYLIPIHAGILCITNLISEMKRGWWKISRSEHLTEVTDAMHQRGVREGELKRNLVKHLEAAVEASVNVSCISDRLKSFFLHCIHEWNDSFRNMCSLSYLLVLS